MEQCLLYGVRSSTMAKHYSLSPWISLILLVSVGQIWTQVSPQALLKTALSNNLEMQAIEWKTRSGFLLEHAQRGWPSTSFMYSLQNPHLSASADYAHMFSLQQMIPVWGESSIMAHMGSLEYHIAQQEWQWQKRKLRRELLGLIFAYVETQELLTIEAETARLLNQLNAVMQARYATGQGLIGDLISLQIRQSFILQETIRLSNTLTVLGTRIGDSTDLTNSSPDWDFSNFIPGLLLPGTAGLTNLQLYVENHPQFIAQKLREEISQNRLKLSRLDSLPDLGLGLEYMYRPVNGMNMVSFQAMLGLPLLNYSSRQAKVQQNRYLQKQQQASRQDIENYLINEFRRNISWIHTLTEQKRILQDNIVPQARSNIENKLTAYQVQRITAAELFEAVMEYIQYRKTLVSLSTQLYEKYLDLELLSGEDFLSLDKETP